MPETGRTDERLLGVEALRAAVETTLHAHGVTAEDAAAAADAMLAADLSGRGAHGVARLPDWLAALRSGSIDARAVDRTLHETSTSVLRDAGNGLGYAPACRTMEAVVAKAAEQGAAFGALRNANDCGIAGYYARLALGHEMIGLAATNAPRSVVPTFARDALLGPNPLAVAIPAGEEPPFVFDFATGGIGGAGTEGGGHKSYGLGLLVDILCGVLAGGTFGPDLPLATEGERAGARSHFFAAVRVAGFRGVAGFRADMDVELRSFRSSRPAPGYERVVVPGQAAEECERERRAQGVPVAAEVWAVIAEHVR